MSRSRHSGAASIASSASDMGFSAVEAVAVIDWKNPTFASEPGASILGFAIFPTHSEVGSFDQMTESMIEKADPEKDPGCRDQETPNRTSPHGESGGSHCHPGRDGKSQASKSSSGSLGGILFSGTPR